MKKKSTVLPVLGYALAAVGMFVLGTEPAFAIEFSTAAGKIDSQFQSAAELISGGAYLAGAGFGVQSALKFREHNENPQQTKLSKPLTYALVAGALLGLPSFLSIGSDSAGLSNKNDLNNGNLGNEL